MGNSGCSFFFTNESLVSVCVLSYPSTYTHTRAKRVRAFSTFCYGRGIRPSAGLGFGGFSWLSRIGILPATPHSAVSLAGWFLDLSLYLGQTEGTGISAALSQTVLSVLPPVPVLVSVSLSSSSTSVLAHPPPNLGSVRFVSCECLRGLKTNCRSALHWGESMPPNLAAGRDSCLAHADLVL